MPVEQGNPAPRVLIVDDYPPFRRVAARLLAKDKYKIVEASDGLQALRLARRQACDLMLLDLKLGPPIGGDAVLKELRADPATAALPVIAMSGVAQRDEVSRILQDGAADFVAKAEIDTLVKSVARALSPAPGVDVLHVDDDDEWALLVERWLGRRGLRVHRLRTHGELRAYLSQSRTLPRCLLLDLTLAQGEDGFGICGELKASPAYQSVPVVILTAKPVSRVDCLKQQALYRVAKDSGAETELGAAIDSILAQQDRTYGIIETGDLRLDSRTGEVHHGGRVATLRGGSLPAFVKLVLASPRPVSKLDLYKAFLLRGPYQTIDDELKVRLVLGNYLSILRGQLGETLGRRVVAVRGEGYAYRP
jgi:DNA-binding response OmpR family regulator